MTIRALTAADIDIVPEYVTLFEKVLGELSPYYTETSLSDAKARYTTAEITRNLESPENKRFIGHFNEGTLDGLLIETFDNADGERAVINWVMANKKGHGIGSQLISDCIKRATTEKKQSVYLALSVKNTHARRLYQKLGFISGGEYVSEHNVTLEVMAYFLK